MVSPSSRGRIGAAECIWRPVKENRLSEVIQTLMCLQALFKHRLAGRMEGEGDEAVQSTFVNVTAEEGKAGNGKS